MTRLSNVKQGESFEQTTLFTWAALNTREYPELKLLYHIPNGGLRDKKTASRLKSEGVKAGVPDLHLPVPRGIFHGLYIEMKYGRNKPTDNQREWLKDLEEQGHRCAVCYTWHDASELIKRYLNLAPGEDA